SLSNSIFHSNYTLLIFYFYFNFFFIFFTSLIFFFFFFNHTSTTEIYTLSLHDALPIYRYYGPLSRLEQGPPPDSGRKSLHRNIRSEEHTSELQSRENLVCRLLLEKKKKKKKKKKIKKKKILYLKIQ